MSNDELLCQIRQLVAEGTGYPIERITPETTLFGDLGIDGDDARALFAAYSKQFHVDLSGFVFGRHFGGEGIWPHQLPALVWRLFRSVRGDEPHAIAGLSPITIADLVAAAHRGRWISPRAQAGAWARGG